MNVCCDQPIRLQKSCQGLQVCLISFDDGLCQNSWLGSFPLCRTFDGGAGVTIWYYIYVCSMYTQMFFIYIHISFIIFLCIYFTIFYTSTLWFTIWNLYIYVCIYIYICFFSKKICNPPRCWHVCVPRTQDLLLVFAGKEALDRGFVKPEEVHHRKSKTQCSSEIWLDTQPPPKKKRIDVFLLKLRKG